MPIFFQILTRSILPLLLTLQFGCQTLHRHVAEDEPVFPDWVIYDGVTGGEISWNQMVGSVLSSQIILVGERHDDAIAHELEQRLVEELLAGFPNSAVTMEMFERDEQVFLDLFLAQAIDSDALAATTDVRGWGGEENWRLWYLPIVESVRDRVPEGATLLAANSPRSYVRLSRFAGHQVLSEIDQNTLLPLFAIPRDDVDEETYRTRFFEMMGGHAVAGKEEGEGLDIESFFRAQQVWDATMAESVRMALAKHPKVLLIAGDFHIAQNGGVLQRLRHLDPFPVISTISIRPVEDPTSFRTEDAERADFVIYTRADT
ncbi:MAG: ChaN family lipoprotein [Verrucomicrobiota bacterium]